MVAIGRSLKQKRRGFRPAAGRLNRLRLSERGPPEVWPYCWTGKFGWLALPSWALVVATAVADGAGGDVVVAAALKATRRRHGGDTSGSGVALGQSGRSNRANAQDDSSNSRSNTSVHGTIHLGLRGLRRMAAGRDLFSDLDLGPSQPERRAVWHSRIDPTFRPREYVVMIRPRTTVPFSAAPYRSGGAAAPPWQEAIVPLAKALRISSQRSRAARRPDPR